MKEEHISFSIVDPLFVEPTEPLSPKLGIKSWHFRSLYPFDLPLCFSGVSKMAPIPKTRSFIVLLFVSIVILVLWDYIMMLKYFNSCVCQSTHHLLPLSRNQPPWIRVNRLYPWGIHIVYHKFHAIYTLYLVHFLLPGILQNPAESKLWSNWF